MKTSTYNNPQTSFIIPFHANILFIGGVGIVEQNVIVIGSLDEKALYVSNDRSLHTVSIECIQFIQFLQVNGGNIQ